MRLSPEDREKRLKATREVAAAFIEDMGHIRKVLSSVDPDRGEVRRLSGVLRRLLIDGGGDLGRITAPRLGKFTLSAPDNKPFYKAGNERPYAFFQSAGVKAFGVYFRAFLVKAATAPLPKRHQLLHHLKGFDLERTIELPMDNFLSQRVLCLQGQWITRRDAIKYVAHKASGVHSEAPKTDMEKVIAQIRSAASYSALDTDTAKLSFNPNALSAKEPDFQHTPSAIDPVLVEVFATAHFLAISPDILKLETDVRAELDQFA